ncbi:copper amine oxidase [Solibacillus sp. FSL H8-0538]|uniref:copper amine oxidase n=1 Tax=Solibacillus sp. FSL H8-0538 TaxID=2921400 RepID=UPI0030FB402E
MAERSKLIVEVVPFGPDQETMNQLRSICDNHPIIQPFLRGTRHLLLSFELLDLEDIPGNKSINHPKSSKPTPPSNFLATYYDYTNNRTVIATGPIHDPGCISASQLDMQPLPSTEEFELALNIVRDHPELGCLIRENLVRPYRAMPALIDTELPDGRIERTLAVGLLPVEEDSEDRTQNTGEPLHQIVGVNMIRREVILYETGAPPFSTASVQICEPPPDANQPTARRGTLGQYQVRVLQGDTEVWSFLAVRPAASSGIVGSGIELRDVLYRGKKVLSRAHVPILNVRYDNDVCGPYRDWQWQEGRFEAIGTDIAPGFRMCSTPARTILDTGFDTGNFFGVAIYVDGDEIVLVSELEAGWYRYISEWRLHNDGTIRPRFGFGAIANSCTCNPHTHHVYWRFDFDIRTEGNNFVQEINEKPSTGTSIFRTLNYEIRRSRDTFHNRQWLISNKSTGEGYTLIPGKNDGSADSFGVGDVWFLRYRSSELDDGQGFTTNLNKARANLDKFLNKENINGQDIVVWYAAHFRHDETSEENVSHILGPELKPRNW